MEKTFAQEIAETITGPYDQHSSLMIVGKTGSGKSFAALYIAYRVACEVAKIKGGTWKDYFSMDNIAIIKLDDIFKTLYDMKKYNIYICDDIGVGWSARRWKSEANQIMNDIAQTFRTENTFLILTLPDNFLIDKVPRTLVHYFGEMTYSIFKYNISVMKLFEIKRQHRRDKTYYVYPLNHKQFVRYLIRKPPEELIKEYKPLRELKAREMREEKLRKYLDKEKDSDNKEKKKGIWLRCYRCGHEWEYTGQKRDRAQCPQCTHKVRFTIKSGGGVAILS
jgi:DNA-directed RNA polymerase subunit RPC12/RpoP/ABC-type dipeptide/oligopeptide/nickel transport system ATPase component